MAKQNGSTQTPHASNGQDSAVAAKQRLDHASDDAAFDLATVELENAPATTVPGVLALFELYSSRADDLLEGDQMSPEIMAKLACNIRAGLAHLMREAA